VASAQEGRRLVSTGDPERSAPNVGIPVGARLPAPGTVTPVAS
jgi:hypothetical protein